MGGCNINQIYILIIGKIFIIAIITRCAKLFGKIFGFSHCSGCHCIEFNAINLIYGCRHLTRNITRTNNTNSHKIHLLSTRIFKKTMHFHKCFCCFVTFTDNPFRIIFPVILRKYLNGNRIIITNRLQIFHIAIDVHYTAIAKRTILFA